MSRPWNGQALTKPQKKALIMAANRNSSGGSHHGRIIARPSTMQWLVGHGLAEKGNTGLGHYITDAGRKLAAEWSALEMLRKEGSAA